jgi:hypothetical protein
MKQMSIVGTRRRFALILLATVLPALVNAQSFDTTPPLISHQPVKLGRQGKPLPISAHVADSSGIKSVFLKISYEGESFEGPMPVINETEQVPVVVKVTADQLPVYAGPAETFKKLGELSAGEQVEVTMVRDTYYRIKSDRGVAGYVAAIATETVMQGKLYGVTVPAHITQSAFITYQIVAMDTFGNENKTAAVEVRLIDDKQLAKLQAQAGITPRAGTTGEHNVKPLSDKPSKPFYAKPFFWLATVAAGGGAYYYYNNQQEEKNKDASVAISLEW